MTGALLVREHVQQSLQYKIILTVSPPPSHPALTTLDMLVPSCFCWGTGCGKNS